jgi:hypothetical protein
MALDAYTYIFAIGTLFALLEAFNNGASMCSPQPYRVPLFFTFAFDFLFFVDPIPA